MERICKHYPLAAFKGPTSRGRGERGGEGPTYKGREMKGGEGKREGPPRLLRFPPYLGVLE